MKTWAVLLACISVVGLPVAAMGAPQSDKAANAAIQFRDHLFEAMGDIVAARKDKKADPVETVWPEGVSFSAGIAGFNTEWTTRDDLYSREFNPKAATFKAWDMEFLTAAYQDWAAEQQSARNADLEMFLELNQRAIRTWDLMVACMEDEEAARDAYATGKFQCVNDTSGAQVVENIRELHGNMLDFIQTTDIQGTLSALGFARKTPVIQMHPLLFQVVEEIFSVWFPFGKTTRSLRSWIKKSTATENSSERSNRMVNLLPLIGFRSMPIGLWPTALDFSHAYFLAKLSRLSGERAQIESTFTRLGFGRLAKKKGFDRLTWLAFINPWFYPFQAVHLGIRLIEDQASIEPENWYVAEALIGRRIGTGEWDRIRGAGFERVGKKAREITKRLRAIAARYGITEDNLFAK